MAHGIPDGSPAQLQEALRQLETAFDTTLQALGAAQDLRAQETPGHSEGVAAYTLELATAMGIDDPATLAQMRRGAVLHDVGKILVPESILRKPGPLNARRRWRRFSPSRWSAGRRSAARRSSGTLCWVCPCIRGGTPRARDGFP